MSTRYLMAVVHKGEYVVAQYGNADGYPSGEGQAIINYVATMDVEHFRRKVELCHFLTQDEILFVKGAAADERQSTLVTSHASNLLPIINEAISPVPLIDSVKFSGNSLFCEWAYVIDLDREVFEVYRGFNTSPLEKTERFFSMFDTDQGHRITIYHPVKFVSECPFVNLVNFDIVDADDE